MKIATDTGSGYYELSPPVAPYRDGMRFSKVLVVIRDDDGAKGTWISGVDWSGEVHPAPLLQTPMVLEPSVAIAILGYDLD